MSKLTEMELEAAEARLLAEKYGVGSSPAMQRPIEQITQDIKTHQMAFHHLGQMMLIEAIEVGRYLSEAKAALPHGRWGEYLKNEVDVSPSTAQNFMKVFRDYGDDQQSLFGAPKSQTFGNLTYSKALKLLAIEDEEERERFVIEHDVEHMSVRKLNEALKARAEAEEKAAAAQDEADRLEKRNVHLQEQLADQAKVYEAKLTSAGVEADQARAAEKAAQEALEKQRDKAQRLQTALSEANTATQAAENKHAKLLRELEELKNRPVDVAVEVDQAAINELNKRVNESQKELKEAKEERKAAEDNLAAAQKELAELKARGPEVRELTQEEKDALTAEAVSKARAEGAEQIRGLEKKLAMANPNVAEFNVRFKSWQEEYWKIMEVVDRIARDDDELAAKPRQLVKAALEQMA